MCQTEFITTSKWTRPMQLTCIAHWICWIVCHSFWAFPLPSKSSCVSLCENPGWTEYNDCPFPKLVYFYWLYIGHTPLKQTVPFVWKINFVVTFPTWVGGLLWMRWWVSGFHKRWRISWLGESLLASQERICSMELIIPHGWEQSGPRYASVVGSQTHLHVTLGR